MKKGIQLLLILLLVLSVNVVSAKEYKCETVDGAYYGKDGNEVDKVQYENECLTHSCEIVGDSYYGENGNKVDKKTFEKECDATVVSDVPDTGSSISPTELIFTILGSCFILGAVAMSIAHHRMNPVRD